MLKNDGSLSVKSFEAKGKKNSSSQSNMYDDFHHNFRENLLSPPIFLCSQLNLVKGCNESFPAQPPVAMKEREEKIRIQIQFLSTFRFKHQTALLYQL